jgi:hypothetical protein
MFITSFSFLSGLYPTISDGKTINFFIAGCIIVFILFIFLEITYQPFTKWLTSLCNYLEGDAFVLLLGGLFFLVIICPVILFNYFNQHAVTSPIINVKTQIISKQLNMGKRGLISYSVLFDIFNIDQRISGGDLYKQVEAGDKITVKIKKGRFGKFFALELEIEKNKYHYKLAGKDVF